MEPVLRDLDRDAWILDLGSGPGGSFPAKPRLYQTVRVDRSPPAPAAGAPSVAADAGQLPFRTGSIAAIVSNHSLEHFAQLEAALAEIGRVAAPGGRLFVSVPGASTPTDRIYRWLSRGGGHVNAFESPGEVQQLVEKATGLPWVATRPLFSSFSFLNRRHGRPPRRAWLLGGGHEAVLRWAGLALRTIDSLAGTRLSRYGWAFYFGTLPDNIPSAPWSNTCVRCGSSHPSDWLRESGRTRRRFLLPAWKCPDCGAPNFLTDDSRF